MMCIHTIGDKSDCPAAFDPFASSAVTSLPSSKRPHPTISMRMFPSSNSLAAQPHSFCPEITNKVRHWMRKPRSGGKIMQRQNIMGNYCF